MESFDSKESEINTESLKEGTIVIHSVEDSKTTRLFKLINRLAADEIQRYSREQLLGFPFFVTDIQLKEFAEEILKVLQEIQSTEPIDFTGTVRFQDLSAQKFDNFENFLERAGKRKDPQSIYVAWNKFAVNTEGEPISGQVEISFITEKRLKTGHNDPEAIHLPKIEIIVSGSAQRWVDEVFEDLVPLLKTTAHGGIMRPLWIFQHPYVVQLSSLLMGYIAMIVESQYANSIRSKGFHKEEIDIIKKIKSLPNIEQKFDYYITWALTPSNSSTKEAIGYFVASILTFISAYLFAKFLLPLLTPSSAIAIGTARRRAISALDTFKFIIFTLIVGGILLPLLRTLFSLFW